MKFSEEKKEAFCGITFWVVIGLVCFAIGLHCDNSKSHEHNENIVIDKDVHEQMSYILDVQIPILEKENEIEKIRMRWWVRKNAGTNDYQKLLLHNPYWNVISNRQLQISACLDRVEELSRHLYITNDITKGEMK